MSLLSANTTRFIVISASILLYGVFSFAQNYKWANLGSIGVEWGYPGVGVNPATYNQNSGSVVIGGTNPSGSLLVDIGGALGGTIFCSEERANCLQFQAVNSWKYNGTEDWLYVVDTTTQVGIGVTSPTQRLHIGGNILADSFLYSSDQNLKTNITPLNGLDIISQLEGVRFDWIDSGESEVGVIAQQVEEVLPELVVTDEETGNKLVQYANLVAPLIEAVNEQRQQLEEIEQEIQQVQKERRR